MRCIYLLLFLLSFQVTGCTSLFYQPTRDEYHDVDTSKIQRDVISLETSDHKKLNGWYFPQKKKSKGLVLFFHGNAENITSHFVTLFWFTEAGYDYALFDYRGYGKSTGNVNNDKAMIDVKTMMDWGLKVSKEKKIPLIVYGQSLGANLSLKYLSLHPEVKPNFYIAEAPFYKFTEIAAIKAKQAWILWPLRPFVNWIVSDLNSLDENELKNLPKYPKVFLHSENDPVVPFSQGKKTFTYASEPKELWSYKAPHHVNGTHTENGKFRKMLLERLKGI
ncbi:MAG: alpha/beta fold hydrolase [Bdellovibrionales bacterium]|nr:alpha/beta fold hydrolase [Bdellovibrionales bacterium]